ncbi:MAG: hypothetical protein Ct9H300mP23_00840 [Nitrospinota bacterium]|nr:MAG: hypothetical protein Ct9H300mP23_00840 [Nitrospinota bacterium]
MQKHILTLVFLQISRPIYGLMTLAQGQSIIVETVFENRFMHVSELKRMGPNFFGWSYSNHKWCEESFGGPLDGY